MVEGNSFGLYDYFYSNEENSIYDELKKEMVMQLNEKGIEENGYNMEWKKIVKHIDPFNSILMGYPENAKGTVACRVDISPKGSEN